MSRVHQDNDDDEDGDEDDAATAAAGQLVEVEESRRILDRRHGAGRRHSCWLRGTSRPRMTGAPSDAAQRPITVVAVDGVTVVNVRSNAGRAEQQHHQHQHQHQQQQQQRHSSAMNNREPCRSFTSTETQTESTRVVPPSARGVVVGHATPSVADGGHHPYHQQHHSQQQQQQQQQQQRPDQPTAADSARDARRRERRVRRQHRRAMRTCSLPTTGHPVVVAPSTMPAQPQPQPQPPPPPTQPATTPGVATTCQPAGTTAVPLVPAPRGVLHPPPPHLGLRGLSLGLPFPVPASVSPFARDAVPKQCCGLGSPPVRWSILGVGVVGLVCAGAGALLGALRATGRDHIAVALLMIGIGVVLVTVSAVAWRATSRENCGSFFGFTGISGRIPPARPMHPYAAMIYPEFQFRTPPPSYQASMQEYRLRLLLLDRLQPTSSPPPTYRSNAGSVVAPTTTPATTTSTTTGPTTTGTTTTTTSTTTTATTTTTRDVRAPPSYCARNVATVAGVVVAAAAAAAAPASTKKDANLVRIVQTEAEPVILSGDQTPPCAAAAVEVLAHV